MIGDRINIRLKELNISIPELAKRTGIPIATTYRIINGEIKSPRSDNLPALAKALNTSIDWLVTGKESKAASIEIIRTSKKDDHNTISIPLIESENNHHYNMIIGIDMDLEAVKKLIPSKDYSKLSGLSMPDDSMSKTINSGDPLLIDQNYKAIDIDGIYKIEYGDKIYIRRFQTSPNGDTLMIADNENYKDFTINQKEIKVIGKIVYVWTGKRI